MKKLNIVAILAVALTFAAAGRASAATESADALATIVAAIAITKDDDLDFGQIVPSVDPGTVVMATDGTRSVTGGVTLGNAGSAGPALFTVTGASSATYAITLPTSESLTGPGDPMTLDTFTSDPAGTGLLTGGTQTLKVGGTLHVGANQAIGDYSTSFDVTVAYN